MIVFCIVVKVGLLLISGELLWWILFIVEVLVVVYV